MTGSIAPNRPGHHGTVVARTVGTVAISCNEFSFNVDIHVVAATFIHISQLILTRIQWPVQ